MIPLFCCRYRQIFNALILTSFAQLLAVAAAVWGSGAVQVLRLLAELLGMAASSQAIQGKCSTSWKSMYGYGTTISCLSFSSPSAGCLI